MKTKIRHLLITAIAVVMLCSCELNSPQTTTETLPATEDELASPPSPESTSIPAETETPSATSTAPVIPLSQEGPWLLIYSDRGAMVANSDGTGLAPIAETDEPWILLDLAIAPRGGKLAYFYAPQNPSSMVSNPPELTLVAFPSLNSEIISLLHSGKTLERSTTEIFQDDPNIDVLAALSRGNDLAWSPDGSNLAFVSAQDGPSTDLYVYSMIDRTITRLTDGPTQTIDISWSPDGNYIVSKGVTDMHDGEGGSLGPTVDTVWAVRSDGSGLHSIQTYPDGGEDGPSVQIGWVNDYSYVEYDTNWMCDVRLTFVDILTPQQYNLVTESFIGATLDPATGIVLVAIDSGCNSTFAPGLYLLSAFGDKPPQKVTYANADLLPDYDADLVWSPEAQLFFAALVSGTYTINLEGHAEPIEFNHDFFNLDVSPNGREWAIFGDDGLWLVSPDHVAQQITNSKVYIAIWTVDGSAILYVTDGKLFRASAPDYQPVILAKDLPDIGRYDGFRMEWIMP